MKLATTRVEDSKDRNPMTNSFSPSEAGRAISNAPAKMTESLFIVEYDGSVPLNVPENWPLPSYEVRRKLPMKDCHRCCYDTYAKPGRHPQPRRTSWVARKKGEFFWQRVCFQHMHPDVRAVIKEMYSR